MTTGHIYYLLNAYLVINMTYFDKIVNFFDCGAVRAIQGWLRLPLSLLVVRKLGSII